MIILAAILTMFLLPRSRTAICSAGCLICTHDDNCTFCDTSIGYYYDKTQLQCLMTTQPYCVKINQAGDCLACSPNFALDATTNSCFAVPLNQRIPSCRTYDSGANCISCNTGYVIYKNICTRVIYPISNCDEYWPQGTCKTCATGYAFDSTMTSCQPLPKNSTCQAYSRIKCQSCQTPFIYNQNMFLSNLNDSDVTTAAMFTVNELNGWFNLNVCQPNSDPGCISIDSNGKCSICASGLQLLDGKCSKFPVPSIANCLVYDSNNSCKVCMQGWFAANNSCISVTPIKNCQIYDSGKNSATNCTRCSQNYYLSNQNCTLRVRSAWIANCLYYESSADACAVCRSNFNLTSDGLSCALIVKFCILYAQTQTGNSTLSCQACSDKYYLVNFAQIQVCRLGTVVNCRRYTNTTQKCSECMNGYYLKGDYCEAHVKIPDCQIYSQKIPNACLTCNSNSFNFYLANICVPVQTMIDGCQTYSADGLSCLQCTTGFMMVNGKCVQPSSVIPNCQNITNGQCMNCTSQYMLNSLVTPQTCIAPLNYMTTYCSRIGIGILGSTAIWSSNNQTTLLCQVCNQMTYPYTPAPIEAICVLNSQLSMYSGYTIVPNCVRFGFNATNQTQLQCMQCASGFYISRYWNTGLGVTTYCRNGCPTAGGLYVVIPDDLLGFVNICSPVGTKFGYINEYNCSTLARVTTANGNTRADYNCIGAFTTNNMLTFNFPVTGIVFDSFNVDPLQPSNLLIDFAHPFAQTDIPLLKPSKLNYRGPLYTVAFNYNETDPRITNANLTNCEVVWVLGNDTFNGSIFNSSGALGGLYTPVTQITYACLKCIPGYNLVYNQSTVTPYSPTLTCNQMSSLCMSTTIFGGLPSYLNVITSCHTCGVYQYQQTYPVVRVEYAANVTVGGVQGNIIQYAIPERQSTVFEFNSTFNCELPPVNISINQSSQTIPRFSSCAIFGALYPVNTSGLDPMRSQIMNVCLACQTGYYPSYFGTSGAPLVVGTYMAPPYIVTGCTASVNCDTSILKGPFNSCQKCITRLDSQLNTLYYAFTDHHMVNCLLSASPNCYLLSTANSLSATIPNPCKVCSAGHYLNIDGMCEILVIPNSDYAATFTSSYYYNRFVRYPAVRTARDDIIDVFIHYQLIMNKASYGVSKCSSGYSLMPANSLIPSLCVSSTYLAEMNAKPIPSSIFISNCIFYKAQTTSGQFRCAGCQTGFLTTADGTVCLPQIFNCLYIVNATFSNYCAVCQPGTLNVGGVCTTPMILGCSVYLNNETSTSLTNLTCAQCKEGYVLSTDGGVCSTGTVAGCKTYAVNSTVNCLECMKNYMMMTLSNSTTYCYPVPMSYSCNSFSDPNTANTTGPTLSCLTCLSNSTNAYTAVSINALLDLSVPVTRCLRFNSIQNCSIYDQNKTILNQNSLLCLACDSGFWLSADRKTCILRLFLDKNCAEYSPNNDFCTTCKTGYFIDLTNKTCVSYPDGSPFCINYTSTGSCQGCLNGYYLSDKGCSLSAVVANCLAYSGNSTCSQCIDGFYLNSNNTCTQSSTFACVSFDSNNACTLCKDGYGLMKQGNNATCVRNAIENCLISTIEWPFSCITCRRGYYVLGSGLCGPVLIPIPNCDIYDSISTCAKCNNKTVLSASKNACILARFVSWIDPFCNSSVITDDFVCTACKQGNYFQNGTCTACNPNSNATSCQYCNPNNTTNCLICASGFWMSPNGTCLSNYPIDYPPTQLSHAFLFEVWLLTLLLIMHIIRLF